MTKSTTQLETLDYCTMIEVNIGTKTKRYVFCEILAQYDNKLEFTGFHVPKKPGEVSEHTVIAVDYKDGEQAFDAGKPTLLTFMNTKYLPVEKVSRVRDLIDNNNLRGAKEIVGDVYCHVFTKETVTTSAPWLITQQGTQQKSIL